MVIPPRENSGSVDKAYEHIMSYLKDNFDIQKFAPPWQKEKWLEARAERNADFKEHLRLLFELESWESW